MREILFERNRLGGLSYPTGHWAMCASTASFF